MKSPKNATIHSQFHAPAHVCTDAPQDVHAAGRVPLGAAGGVPLSAHGRARRPPRLQHKARKEHIIRADRNSQLRQYLGLSTADFWYWPMKNPNIA